MTKMISWAERHLGRSYHPIPLQSLSLDQSAILLQRLLSIPDLPERLRQQILQRAAGIPFYLEEILRMLIDEGAIEQRDGRWSWVPGSDAAALGVPDTLQGLILARFDRLDSFERRVLQVATVIGKNFSLPVLKWVLEPRPDDDLQQALSSLSDREFIQPLVGKQSGKHKAEEQSAEAPCPEDQDTEYTFRHILMSDAIYSTLLRRERSRLHGKVGEAIETLYADRLEGQIELLANHYRFSPRLDRALHYLILAGQKAARNNVNEQARQHFEAALEILSQVEPSAEQVLQVHLGLGDALVFTGDYPAAREHYLAGLKALDREDGPRPAAQERSTLYRKLARTYERHGDYEQAVIHLSRAKDALDISRQPYPVDRALVMNDLGWIHFRQGNFPEAQQILQAALDLVKDSNAYDTIASIENRLGGVAYNLGNWDAAAGYLRESIAMREAIRDVVGLSSSFNNLGYLEVEMGELDHALENLTRCYELKSHLGQAEGIGIALNNLGWLHIQRGDLEKARQLLSEALDLARQIGYSSLHRQILKNIGELNLTACEWEKAREVLSELVPALESLGAKDQLLDTYRLLGEAALGLDDLEAGLNWEQKALDLIDSLSSEAELSAIQRGEIRRFRGMLAMRQGDYATAEAALQESAAIFNKLGSRLYQGRVACQLGLLYEAQGDLSAAREHYAAAEQIFGQIGASLEQARASRALQAIFA